MKLILFLLAFLFLTAPALADVFDAPCSRYRVPKRLVLAIAKTESGLDPLCVNIAGKTYRPGSRAGALAIIRQAHARGRSHDIGLMQINNWWLKHLRISPEVALEPRNNAMLGVWILANEIRRHGYNWTAVGALRLLHVNTKTFGRYILWPDKDSANQDTLRNLNHLLIESNKG